MIRHATLESLLFDVRLAVRALRRDRLYSATAVIMLAVALALNVAVFTVTDAMLYRGFPLVRQNDRIAYIQEHTATTMCCLSYADFEVWRSDARSFEALAFLGSRPTALRDSDGRQADLTARVISANTFRMLGVSPLLGRDFVDDDEADGAPQTASMSYRFWRQRYEGNASVVGSTVELNGVPTTIIAVMPERFDFTSETSLWVPVTRTRELLQRGPTTGSHVAVGRLRDGVSIEEARAELESINRRLAAAYPETNRGRVPRLFTRAQFISGPDAPLIWGSLWAGSWFVLFIACANLANLTLVRTIGRWPEFVTTLALGAGRLRLIRQILIESAVLTIVASSIAWAIAARAVDAWSIATASRYQILDYTIDGRTFAYLATVALLATILFSIAPIARIRNLAVSGALRSDGRGISRSPWSRHLSSGLVAMQMTLAIVLLAGAGILVRSLTNITRAETGVRHAETVLSGMLRLPSLKYPGTPQRLAILDRIESALRTIPGIDAVSVSSGIPIKFSGPRRAFEIDGRPVNPDDPVQATTVTAGPEYFQVLGAPPLSGRAFEPGDQATAARVAIVNERFVSVFWPEGSPIGQRLRVIDGNSAGEWRTIVGVVPNIMEGDPLRQHFNPVVYTPFLQENPARAVFFLARTSGDPKVVAPSVRSRVRDLDNDVLLENFNTLEENFRFERDAMSFEHSELGKHATVAPVFAGIAVFLSALGLVAVVANSVSQRTKEIGIRMAIGAATCDIARMVFAEGLRPVAAGLVIGMAVSAAVNRLIQAQLVGVSPYDPATMVAAPLVLIVVSIVACQIPARRAARIDPAVALRDQ